MKSRLLKLSQIETRRPPSGNGACVTLGGTNLYARDHQELLATLNQLQSGIETVLSQHFCLIRPVLRSIVARDLEQDVPDRIFGAVLGRALRLGTVMALACLTVNNKILRTHFLASRHSELQEKLKISVALLRSQSAVSVMALQARCFPQREWATTYMAQQLLGHLALRGLAVYVDKDLFSWPKVVDDAVHANR